MNNYSTKNILLGIGIGLIIASIVNINTAQNNMSVEELRREAALHNLVLVDSGEIINNTPTPTSTPASIPSPTPTLPVQVNDKVTITIAKGTSSDNVADILVKNGLIKDKTVFIKRLTALKKVDKLNYGKFTIPRAAAVDEIINIITVPLS